MLEGKVAIVTGAGRGLGRCAALDLARSGARVVVNDLGVAGDGSGKDEEPARAVVDEIRSMGAEAEAHFGDAADWKSAEGMIQQAVDRFGDLHILVNNAGFARDTMMFKMSEEQFDSVIRVHVKGHFAPMRHAAAHWRSQSKAAGGPIYGRLISTASEAFLFGNVGQANYSTAKAGIVSLTMVAARELERYGVTANVYCPRARTRITQGGAFAAMFAKPDDGFDNFAPENSTPLVAYLASPQAQRISGYVLIVWGKEVRVVVRPDVKGEGDVFHSEEKWTPESLHEKLGPYFEKREPITDGFAVPPV